MIIENKTKILCPLQIEIKEGKGKFFNSNKANLVLHQTYYSSCRCSLSNFEKFTIFKSSKFAQQCAVTEARSNGGCHKTSGSQKIHRYREAIQHDSSFLDTVHDP